MLHQKHKSHKFVVLVKNFVDWINTRGERKSYNLKIVHFEKKDQRVKKYVIFPFHDYLL